MKTTIGKLKEELSLSDQGDVRALLRLKLNQPRDYSDHIQNLCIALERLLLKRRWKRNRKYRKSPYRKS